MARINTCRDQCLADLAQAQIATCREVVQLVRAHLKAHGAELDGLLPRIGLVYLQGAATRAVGNHLRARRGLEDRCPEQAAEVNQLVSPHLPKPPAR